MPVWLTVEGVLQVPATTMDFSLEHKGQAFDTVRNHRKAQLCDFQGHNFQGHGSSAWRIFFAATRLEHCQVHFSLWTCCCKCCRPSLCR